MHWNGCPNVNLKFEELLRSSETFKHLNTSILSIGTCPFHVTHNKFRSDITNLDFNVGSFATDGNFFFKLSAARRADYIDIGTVKEGNDELKNSLLQKTSTRRELQRAQSRIKTGMKRRHQLN